MAKKKTLVDKARETEYNRKRTLSRDKEHQDLAIAWAKDEISLAQVSRALGKTNSGNTLYGLSVWLREAVREGRLVDLND